MWRHVTKQMKNVPGGLGEKMEDWVEHQHQDGKRSRDAYMRVANVQARADARAHKGHRRCRADIRAQVELVKSDASSNLKRVKDESAEMKRRKERVANRKAALEQFERPMRIIFRSVKRYRVGASKND